MRVTVIVTSACSCCSGCDGGDRPVYSLGWAASGGVASLVNYPYPMPAATRTCNAKYSKMKRAFTGGSVEVDLTSSQALFKVCAIAQTHQDASSPARCACFRYICCACRP